jgi:hypothetical protein
MSRFNCSVCYKDIDYGDYMIVGSEGGFYHVAKVIKGFSHRINEYNESVPIYNSCFR